MKVILMKTLPSLGEIGEVVNVKDGYARNYLIPNGYAVRADESNIKYMEHQKKIILKKALEEEKEAKLVADSLNGKTYTIERRVSKDNKIYGSVGILDILELLKNDGYDFYKNQVIDFTPIKEIGEYQVKIKIRKDVFAKINIIVKSSDQESKDEEEKKVSTKNLDVASEDTDSEENTQDA